jgi:hypothetical protein
MPSSGIVNFGISSLHSYREEYGVAIVSLTCLAAYLKLRRERLKSSSALICYYVTISSLDTYLSEIHLRKSLFRMLPSEIDTNLCSRKPWIVYLLRCGKYMTYLSPKFSRFGSNCVIMGTSRSSRMTRSSIPFFEN